MIQANSYSSRHIYSDVSSPRALFAGAISEYVVVHENDTAHKPKNLSHVEAAAIPLVSLTAYQVCNSGVLLLRCACEWSSDLCVKAFKSVTLGEDRSIFITAGGWLLSCYCA